MLQLSGLYRTITNQASGLKLFIQAFYVTLQWRKEKPACHKEYD